MSLTDGQLYWDRQDPKNEGWWLSYRDERGNRDGIPVRGDRDAAIQELAAAVASDFPDATIEIHVFRGDERKGRISIIDGIVANWRTS